jgi:hypothetical protein
MASKTFNPFAANVKPKVVRTRDALDVAARYFVYKLYDATRLDQNPWVPLEEIDETQATIARAESWVGGPSASDERSAEERGDINR